MRVAKYLKNPYRVPLVVFTLTFVLLSFVQLKVERPMLLAERFYNNAGWVEIFFISAYAWLVSYKMQDPANVPRWRKTTWTIFSIVFFSQLLTGLAGADKFLMTGKLHLPIPMMILGGPVYRGELSVMTILFLSTIVLTGPAWCSHFCYFGALDLRASGTDKPEKKKIRHKVAIKSTVLILVISTALILRWMNVSALISTLVAIAFGLAGIVIMILFSSGKKKMVHCSTYCPIGTIVNLSRYVNPFRMYIDKNCTLCMKCVNYCKYDSLDQADIRKGIPSPGCTLCGDCLAGCRHDAIKYRFLKLSPVQSRNLYLVLTITLHASCIALARI